MDDLQTNDQPSGEEAERHLTPRELGARLGLAPKTLANWRSSGRGPRFLQLSNARICYRIRDVEAWEESRRSRAAK